MKIIFSLSQSKPEQIVNFHVGNYDSRYAVSMFKRNNLIIFIIVVDWSTNENRNIISCCLANLEEAEMLWHV